MTIVSFLAVAISMGVVYLYGCIGETIIEKVGNLNLGIPGIMCLGALGGVYGVNLYFSIFGDGEVITVLILLISILMAVIFAAAGGLIYAFLTVTLQANQNVTGLTLTTFGLGVMKFLGTTISNANFVKGSNGIRKLFVGYEKLGWFGQIFLSHGFLTYAAIILAILTGIFIKYTRTGLYLRSIGESPATADAQGINVTKYKYLAILIGSSIAGIGGLYYVMERSGGTTFVEAQIDAFGWLAVALVIFSMWKPWVGILGSILFGGLYVLPQYLSISNIQMKLFDILPYVATVVVLVLTSMLDAKNSQPPSALGINYYREDR